MAPRLLVLSPPDPSLDVPPSEDGRRGRHARRPGTIPAKGWKDVLPRVKDEVADDNLSIVAGGVAFYVLLSLFPALAAAVAICAVVSILLASWGRW